jgi:hypothetical protein
MPYPSYSQRRIPTTRATVGAEFAHADGRVDAEGNYAEVIGSSTEVDIDKQVIHRKVELSCGCYWPDADVAGVCAECVAEGTPSNVCKAHYVVCPCGTPCCWRHSHLLDDQTTRLCTRCYLRAKNKALATTILNGLGSAVRRFFAT